MILQATIQIIPATFRIKRLRKQTYEALDLKRHNAYDIARISISPWFNHPPLRNPWIARKFLFEFLATVASSYSSAEQMLKQNPYMARIVQAYHIAVTNHTEISSINDIKTHLTNANPPLPFSIQGSPNPTSFHIPTSTLNQMFLSEDPPFLDHLAELIHVSAQAGILQQQGLLHQSSRPSDSYTANPTTSFTTQPA